MTWLRLDDGFTHHPKFAGWTVTQKWAWLEVMEYCARYKTGGKLPTDLSLLPRKGARTLVELAIVSGWVDVAEDGTKTIHDWAVYNPKDPGKAERQARWRRRKRDARVDADVDAKETERVDDFVDTPSPSTTLSSRRKDGPYNPEQAAASPKGPPLAALTNYAHTHWDDYPNLDVLHDELTDRGATPKQATAIINQEKNARAKVTA